MNGGNDNNVDDMNEVLELFCTRMASGLQVRRTGSKLLAQKSGIVSCRNEAQIPRKLGKTNSSTPEMHIIVKTTSIYLKGLAFKLSHL